MRRPSRSLPFAFALLFVIPPPLAGQLEPPSTGGLVALDQALRMLGHNKRVLMIGAHPDDEDTELLTVLVRGMGAEAAYLSLNRGEGGQNLIGVELGEALGLIRTEELLAARRLDGARQFFTRAYDFGFSKTLDETWSHWPRDAILEDVVRIVRRFRPQIIVSVFSGTPRDGHGQHQAAGWVAREAFRVAGDSSRFPNLRAREQLEPWTPLKLYRSTRFDTAATTLTLSGGALDSAVGKTYHQIAMAGRSLHRSQDMGQLQGIGPSTVRLELVEDRTGRGGNGLFAGIDTTLAGMAAVRGSAAEWDRLAARMRDLRTKPAAAAQVRADFPSTGPANLELAEQHARLDSVVALTSGLLCDAVADDERVIPGQTLSVTVGCWNPGTEPAQLEIELRSGETHTRAAAVPTFLAAGTYRSTTVQLPISRSARFSTPYFLREPRRGDLYAWPAEPALLGAAREPPMLEMVVNRDGRPSSVREVTFRRNDQALGEIRRPLTTVPRVDVKLDPATELWPTDARGAREFTVTLTHGARDSTSGSVRLVLPPGWPEVKPQPFRLTQEDEREVFRFAVRAPKPLRAGEARIRAVARDSAGAEYEAGVYALDYPHIRPRFRTLPASATMRIAPLRLPPLRSVGYVRGAADLVPEALWSVGIPVVLLEARQLTRGDLSRYDVLVIGPRAYETDSALVEGNARVLAFARAGGLVIVQYQQHRFFEGGFAPFPLTVGGPPLLVDGAGSGGSIRASDRLVSHDRVTDESAPVRILSSPPVVLRPNRLGPDDWDDWVQERGLYFARTWDPAYRPVLETHDPDEAPLEGGLLIASVGKGTYVYTGLSFFRQLPAGVPGAFRLFANLLALRQPQAR
jgi:LmbE family N-acetylglucosaminyl deacetylase